MEMRNNRGEQKGFNIISALGREYLVIKAKRSKTYLLLDPHQVFLFVYAIASLRDMTPS